MLKFKTSCAVLAYLSSNLLNEVGLSLFRYFEVGPRVWDIVVKSSRSPSHLLMSSCYPLFPVFLNSVRVINQIIISSPATCLVLRSACLSVCLSVRSLITITTCPNFTKFSVYMCINVAVARSSSDDNAIRYVLPVFVNDVMFSHNETHGAIVS